MANFEFDDIWCCLAVSHCGGVGTGSSFWSSDEEWCQWGVLITVSSHLFVEVIQFSPFDFDMLFGGKVFSENGRGQSGTLFVLQVGSLDRFFQLFCCVQYVVGAVCWAVRTVNATRSTSRLVEFRMRVYLLLYFAC